MNTPLGKFIISFILTGFLFFNPKNVRFAGIFARRSKLKTYLQVLSFDIPKKCYVSNSTPQRAPSKMCLRWAGIFLVVSCIFSVTGNMCYPSDEAIVNKDRINVRVDATAMAPSLGFLKRGERVAIADERFEWYKIVLPKRFSAYAASEFLKEIEGNKVEVIASNLNLRNNPSMSSYVIGQVETGTVFFLRSKKGDWFEVRGYPHIYGWVNKNFLEKYEKLLKLEGTLYPYNGADCEANYTLRTDNNKYFLNITSKGKTKFINKKVKIEGIENKGSCPYIVVYKLVFLR